MQCGNFLFYGLSVLRKGMFNILYYAQLRFNMKLKDFARQYSIKLLSRKIFQSFKVKFWNKVEYNPKEPKLCKSEIRSQQKFVMCLPHCTISIVKSMVGTGLQSSPTTRDPLTPVFRPGGMNTGEESFRTNNRRHCDYFRN